MCMPMIQQLFSYTFRLLRRCVCRCRSYVVPWNAYVATTHIPTRSCLNAESLCFLCVTPAFISLTTKPLNSNSTLLALIPVRGKSIMCSLLRQMAEVMNLPGILCARGIVPFCMPDTAPAPNGFCTTYGRWIILLALEY